MITRYFNIRLLVFLAICLSTVNSIAQNNQEESHRLVALRMIGHKILLSANDSTSRVLPIEKQKGKYRIQLSRPLQFAPEQLVTTIDRIIKKTRIARHYLVEVRDGKTKQVIYSYEIGPSLQSSIVPCRGRVQPKGCYQFFITILKSDNSSVATVNSSFDKANTNRYFLAIPLTFSLLLLFVFFYFRHNKKPSSVDTPYITNIGKYQFDQRNMNLLFENEKTELSSKESDLLLLLYNAANTTLERGEILKNVWGDEGNYIGRTLDVFISKLRKKLEADTNIKIVNVRGVGYRLILNT